MQDVTDFIAGSEVVITNTYHMVYWTHLMGRKAIVLNKFSAKFDYFKHPPQFVECHDDRSIVSLIEAAAERAKTYSDCLDEAIALNNEFFARVRGVVEAAGILPENNYQQMYQLSKPEAWNGHDELRRLRESLADAHRRIDELTSMPGVRRLVQLQLALRRLSSKVRK